MQWQPAEKKRFPSGVWSAGKWPAVEELLGPISGAQPVLESAVANGEARDLERAPAMGPWGEESPPCPGAPLAQGAAAAAA